MRQLTLVAPLIALLILGIESQAQTGALNKDPTLLLKKYLDLDMKGARLSAVTSEAQKPYVAWKEETIWGHIVVITGYTVIEELGQWDVKDNLDVVIPVEFKIVGSLYLDKAVFFPEPHIDRVGFRLKVINGLWRVVDPIIPPHVGQQRTINYVRQAILEESDPARRAALTTLRDEMRRRP